MTEKEFEFKECNSCAKKSGMPVLCASCFHNREVIQTLKNQVLFDSQLEPIIISLLPTIYKDFYIRISKAGFITDKSSIKK